MQLLEIFPWNEHFHTGLDVIDAQHRRLVALLNELASHFAFGRATQSFDTLLAALADYAAYHFATEEAIWRDALSDGDEFAAHLRAHAGFTSFVEGKRALGTLADEAQAAEVLEFLVRWLAAHILESDRRLAYAVLLRREGLPPDEALRRADDRMGSATQSMIKIILLSFDALTRNTLELMRELSRRRSAQAALAGSEALLSAVVDSTSNPIWSVDAADFALLTFNAAIRQHFALQHRVELVRGMLPEQQFANAPGRAELWRAYYQRTLDEGAYQVDYLTAYGGQTLQLNFSPIVRDGAVVGVSVFAEDISARKKAEETLRLLSQAIEQSPSSIIMTDRDGNIEYVNAAFVEKTGYSLAEARGQNPRFLQSRNTPAQTCQEVWTTLQAGSTWHGELINRRKDGSEYVESAVIAPVRQDDGRVTHYVAVNDDITDRKLAEREVKQLAFFDALTGLPNRRQLIERLQQAIGASQRSGSFGAVMMLDLDHFKELNDTQGHDIGDRLLVQVAQRLKACVRTEDVVARLGGDEFIVIAEGLGADAEDAALRAERMGQQILDVMKRPYLLDEHADALNLPYLLDEHAESHRSTASLGVAMFCGDPVSVESLLKQADLAMYKAKEDGRDALRFFNPDMQRAIDARVAMEEAIRRGLERGEFQLHYQPQVDLEGHVTGAEALVRWTDGQGCERTPPTFIPIAESSGLIVPLGNWVLNQACIQLKAWESEPRTASLTIAVNVSARQFHAEDFVTKVREAVTSHAVNPRRLKLELTESTLVSDIDEVIARMVELNDIGIRFSLDDFGTGYSSLAYLKRMPLDQIKIDQSFVRDIEHDPNDAAIVRAIIALCVSLDLDVIAEGVETQTQLAFLVRKGCRAFQGYLFGRAVPAAQWVSSTGAALSGLVDPQSQLES